MSVLIPVFARPTVSWVENVLYGIIKKKKKKFVNLKKSPMFLRTGVGSGGLFPCWGERCTNYFIFPSWRAQSWEKEELEAGTSPARSAGSGPTGWIRFYVQPGVGSFIYSGEKTRSMAPVYYNMFWSLWLIYVIFSEENIYTYICIYIIIKKKKSRGLSRLFLASA